jgi:FKBP-type peptidyl-prolyl cis-trans isomerase (trigger factor)
MGIPQESISENIEKLRASTGEQAIKELKRNIIMEDVVSKLEITVSDPEVNGWIYQIASQYDRRPEKVRDELQANGRLDELKSQIGMEKAIDKILEMAEVVDGPGNGGAKTAVKKVKTTKKTAKKIAQKAEDNKDGPDKKAPAKKTKKTVKRKAPESDK